MGGDCKEYFLGGYFIFCCNMKVVCVLLLVAFCAVHAKRDAYLDILADEFEKMGMMDEDGGWDELEKPVPNAKPEEPEPAVGPGKPELPTVKPKKQEPPTAKPEKPEPPTAEPEKPEPPTAEPENQSRQLQNQKNQSCQLRNQKNQSRQ